MTRPSYAGLVVAAPLRVERLAVGRLPGARVLRTGMGPARAARALAGVPVGILAVAGLAGALDAALRPGDVVVASEVRDGAGAARACAGYAGLAAGLRARRLTVHVGAVLSLPRLVDGPARAEAGRGGALAVDLESAALLATVPEAPAAVLRVVVDTPTRPLASRHTVAGGIRALRVLRTAAHELPGWAHEAAGVRSDRRDHDYEEVG